MLWGVLAGRESQIVPWKIMGKDYIKKSICKSGMCFPYIIYFHFLWNGFQFLGYFASSYNLSDGE